jgi:hypothetical protein
MLRYYYINKKWMVSGTAQHVYRVTAKSVLGVVFHGDGIAVDG